MNALGAHEVLATWERGQRQHLIDRALTLLQAGWPHAARHELAGLCIGRRDAALLALYERTFSGKLDGTASCPGCKEQLEFAVAPSEIRVPEMPTGQAFEVAVAGATIQFRLPTSLDLAALAGCPDLSHARLALARRCVLLIQRDSAEIADDESLAILDAPGVLDALAARMADCDPQAEVLLDLTCPACEQRWQVLLDIATFLWGRLQSTAQRLVQEVHALARAYGWREEDILAMSAARRKLYLDLVTA